MHKHCTKVYVLVCLVCVCGLFLNMQILSFCQMWLFGERLIFFLSLYPHVYLFV